MPRSCASASPACTARGIPSTAAQAPLSRSPARASASANPTPARPGPMIPTRWGATLVPQGRRCLGGRQGEEILGRLGAARQTECGLHLAVFLPLAAHFRRTAEDVARDLVAEILGDDVAGAPKNAVRQPPAPRPQPTADPVRPVRGDGADAGVH